MLPAGWMESSETVETVGFGDVAAVALNRRTGDAAAVEALDLIDEIQVASFHPHYQFADTETEDITNYTNRSPFPTLHLLRQASVDKAVEAFPEAEAIFGTNVETLRKLGPAGWARLFAD